MQQEPTGYAEAIRIRDRHLTQRAKALMGLRKYVEGTQYDGLPDWFSEKKPLWERAPCVVYPIVRTAIDSNADLLLGEGRFPEIRVDGLEGEQAESFEDAISKIIRQARFRAASREIFGEGQSCGTAVAIFGVRNNQLFIDTALAEWCVPTLEPDGSVSKLEIKYPFLQLTKTADGEKWVCKMYRRVIDAATDTVFPVIDAPQDGTEPKWGAGKSTMHGLGFCPVVWFQHLRGCQVVDDLDGRAIHEHLTDEIRAHDFALSQRHRAALFVGDPQWVEIGVQPGFNPSGVGRRASVPGSVAGRPGDAQTSSYVSEANPGKARKKTPGTVWQYPGKNPETKVELITLPGDSLVAIDNHARDLRMKLCESLGVVFLDAESLPNESRLSGRALEAFKARQLDRVDYYREDFGDKFILPALGMLIRIAIKKVLKVPNLETVQAAITEAGDQWSWHAPPLDLIWGDYFKQSGEDEQFIVTAVVQAKTAGIATTRVCAEKLRTILGIKDVDGYMAELEKEQAEQQQKELDTMKAQAALQPKPAGPPNRNQ